MSSCIVSGGVVHLGKGNNFNPLLFSECLCHCCLQYDRKVRLPNVKLNDA